MSRAIIALLAVAFALAPFHAHESSPQTGKSVIVLADSGQDRTDTAPDTLKSDCPACMLMKTIEFPRTHERSEELRITESIAYPVTDVGRPRRLIAKHFRPPCSTRV